MSTTTATEFLEDSPAHKLLAGLALWNDPYFSETEKYSIIHDIFDNYAEWQKLKQDRLLKEEERGLLNDGYEIEEKILVERLSINHIAQADSLIDYLEPDSREPFFSEAKAIRASLKNIIQGRWRRDCIDYRDALLKVIKLLEAETKIIKKNHLKRLAPGTSPVAATYFSPINSLLNSLKEQLRGLNLQINKLTVVRSDIILPENYMTLQVEHTQGLIEKMRHSSQSLFERVLTLIKQAFGFYDIYENVLKECKVKAQPKLARCESWVQWMTEGEVFSNPLPRCKI